MALFCFKIMFEEYEYFVYIMASKRNGTLYIGITNDLFRRVEEHKNGLNKSFTKKYGVKMLVYYEIFDSILDAIHREKILKKWNRNWKLRVIEEMNPSWKDFYYELFD